MRKNRITKEDYIQRFSIHNGKYDYSNIDFSTLTIYETLSLVCPYHGEFTQVVRDHTKADGCKKCKSIKSSNRQRGNLESFKVRSKEIHSDYYSYDQSVYPDTAHQYLIVTCPLHGDFNISPNHHLNGKGCRMCNRPTKHGNLLNMIQNPNKYREIKATIYYVKFAKNEEYFYKIGVTTDKLEKRLNRIPYKTDIIYFKETNMLDAYLMEDRVKFLNQNRVYKPLVKFAGYETECFKEDVLLDKQEYLLK